MTDPGEGHADTDATRARARAEADALNARLEASAAALERRAAALSQNPEVQEEWVRQNRLGYAGLVAVGLVMIQPFLAARSLDVAGYVCVVAFAVAIPLLAALILVAHQEMFRHRPSNSRLVSATKVIAQACAFTGMVAGFWHIDWVAGIAALAAGFCAVFVHSAGVARLEGLTGRTVNERATAE
jgi:cobalamin synthase